MIRSLLITFAFSGFLASCADTPSKPIPTSGTSSSGITSQPEKPFECDEDLILEPHLPEDCIPPEPPAPVELAESPKPEPIVGTYKDFPINYPNFVSVWRIFPDGTATMGHAKHLWENRDGEYHFRNANGGNPLYVVKIQSIAGEPDLVSKPPAGVTFSYSDGESIKLSSDPLYSFDFYTLGGDGVQWSCYNVGRGEKGRGYYFLYPGYPKFSADSREECEALCPALISHVYSHPDWRKNKSQSQIQQTLANATCPQDRRE